jgi:hypothetical protein
MAFTTPPTFIAADPLAAADLNILGDDIAYLKAIADGLTFSGVSVSRAAATSISTATDTDITFTAEAFDYGSWWSSGISAVVPASAIPAGFTTIAVALVFRAVFATNATGYRAIKVMVNGSATKAPTIGAVSGAATEQNFTTVEIVAAGDTLGMAVLQTSGGSLNVSSSSMLVYRIFPVA